MMNEKIKELAEQAGFFPVPDDTESDWEYRAENAKYEKFAELIIMECINQCFSEDDERIAKHFGMDIEDEE
jgi:hypothetical protein